ncbi:MAG: protein kinase [Gemmataceae bacterium]
MTEEDIFHEALARGPADRAAYLAEVCAGDPGLRASVDALLRANVGATGFLSAPAADATVDLPSAVEGAGTVIGPYKLLEPIGEGGFGVVYLAEQTHPLRRKVALKVLKPGMDTRQVVARFEAERQALALMDHPNIARVFDGGATGSGRPYFVMELVKGVPVTEFCDQHQLTTRERLGLFVSACRAVQHAHQKGIVHRDIKPSNVLVSRHDTTPVVKVIDFGVAKALGQELTDKTLFTGVAQMIGTPLYMAPEQAGMSDLDADTRSDVYSLGVLLYELLTGTTPFTRDRFRQSSYDEIRRIIREEEPPRPSTRLSTLGPAAQTVSVNRRSDPRQLSRSLRGDLDWIVMKALEKDRARRYDSASEFAADVERHLADQPVHARPPSVAYRVRKFARRNRSSVLLSAGLLLSAAAAAAGGWLYDERAREAEQGRQQVEHARRVREAHEKVPLIQAAIRREQYGPAFDLLTEIEPLIPDHPGLPELWEQCSHTCSVATDPPGADVWRRPYDAADAPWRHVARTSERPVEVRIPRGEHLWRAAKAGCGEVTGLRPPHQAWFKLMPAGASPPDMVPIPGGRPDRPGMGFSVAFGSVEIPAFLIDRYEVTNVEFYRFVTAGGYDRAEFWRDLRFSAPDGKPTTWEAVKPRLVDRTGRPGPAIWRDGAFPPGEDDHPVRGVSWYEAAAFARFAGKSLPTVYHWVQAGQIEASVALAGSPFITRSNFGPRVQPVRSLGGPNLHGVLGMMGNVKEWCWNEGDGGTRFILGGGCGDPIYIPLTLESASPLRRDELFGFRCVNFVGEAKGEAAAWNRVGSIAWPAPPRRDELLDAAAFRLAVLDRFTYDRAAPLDVTSEQADEGGWVHVTARVNAAYRDAKGGWERLTLHLYLPKGIDARTGYQTIVYLPAADAHMLPRIRPLAEEYGLDALVRSGRAVLRPVFHGMYERRYASFDADDKTWEDRRICLGQDLKRAIDYLEQRGDINMSQVGYHGYSFGAEWAGSLVAIEPRIRAVVFEAGGLSNRPLRKERAALEWRHYLPHIRVPVLMVNGEIDPIYPVKESQVPMFDLLGSAVKKHYVHPGGHHMLPGEVKFAPMLRWFDRHLGKPVTAR